LRHIRWLRRPRLIFLPVRVAWVKKVFLWATIADLVNVCRVEVLAVAPVGVPVRGPAAAHADTVGALFHFAILILHVHHCAEPWITRAFRVDVFPGDIPRADLDAPGRSRALDAAGEERNSGCKGLGEEGWG